MGTCIDGIEAPDAKLISNHLALNLHIMSIPFKLISHINAISDSGNEAGHNDTMDMRFSKFSNSTRVIIQMGSEKKS